MKCLNYVKDFRCIGGKCEDSCCIGWDFDVDKGSFVELQKVNKSNVKKLVEDNLKINDNCENEEIEYGKVKINNKKRCPFLDHNNYCVIHSEVGEEYLSTVCTSFPRIVNMVDGELELSLDVACPEAARIVLLKKNDIEICNEDINLNKYLVSNNINTSLEEINWLPVEFFYEIRNKSIQIIKNKEFSMDENIDILEKFIEDLEEEIDFNYHNVLDFIKNYKGNKRNTEFFNIELFENIIEALDLDQIHSEEFKAWTNLVKDKIKDYKQNQSFYMEKFKNYKINNESIIENYLINYIYNSMFPFSEIESIKDGFIMLKVRYEFIRIYLFFMSLDEREQGDDEIVRFIQQFSKSIGHHKTYLINVLNFIRETE